MLHIDTLRKFTHLDKLPYKKKINRGPQALSKEDEEEEGEVEDEGQNDESMGDNILPLE